MEVAVAPPVDTGEEPIKERFDVVGVESRSFEAVDDEEVFRQRQLPLAEDARGLREELGRAIGLPPRLVALAPHRQEERVDAGGVDGMDARHAGEDGGDDRPGELMDEPAEHRVFLRRPPHDRDRPDRAVTVGDAIDAEDREVVPAGVVAEVVAERALRLRAGKDRPFDGEIGLGVNRRLPLGRDHRNPMAGQGSGEGQLRQPFGKGHHRRHRHRRRAADGDHDTQRLAALQGPAMVDADAAVELVVEADFVERPVGVAGQLDAVHAEIRALCAGAGWILGVDTRKRDERAAVPRPGDDPGERCEGHGAGLHRPAADMPREHRQGIQRRPPVAPRAARGGGRIDLQLDEPADTLEGVGENPLDALSGAVEIDEDRKRAAAGIGKQHRRATGAVEPALDLGDLQVGVDRRVDKDSLPLGTEGIDAAGK